MKPFNLERAKVGDKVVNQDGRPARIICFDKMNSYYPIMALVKFEDESGDYEVDCSYDLDGLNNGTSLHMAPVKKQAWVNLFWCGEEVTTGSSYPTEDEARNAYGKSSDSEYYIDTVLLHEWEE